jgi:hypothetical protein
MLVALLTILFLSGGGTIGLLYDVGVVKKDVKSYVTDDERQDAALAVVGQFKDRIKAQNKLIKKSLNELDEKLADHAVPQTELEAIGSEYGRETQSYYSDLLDLRFALKDQVTRDEWEQFAFSPAVESGD